MQKINLRLLRRQHGWSQKQIATKLKITESYYNSIECGRLKAGLATLIKIAELFQLALQDIIDE